MLVEHLVGAVLYTATWLAPDMTPLTEPFELMTFDSMAECEEALASHAAALAAEDLLRGKLINKVPGAVGILLECTPQASEVSL